MSDNKKANQSHLVVKNKQDNECPKKEGDNCLVPGGYNDSEPIGGA